MGVDFIPTGVQTGLSGSITAAPQVVTIGAGGNYVVPAGSYTAYAVGANTQLQVQDATPAWQAVSAVSVGIPFFCSDGTNYRFQNAGGGSQTVTLIKIG
jgi:hypothetical protein